jgi:tetratricopeptide (TPR) repeat protein
MPRAMQCPDEVAVSRAGGDPAAVRALFGDHIDDCTSCRRLVAELLRSGEAPADWRAGQRVGRYVIGERIGRGGMGQVYRATDVELQRDVALKRLHAIAGAAGRVRLVGEARSAAQLQHPNVVAVFEVVDDERVPFIAMELVDGVTLTAWLRQRPRSWREILAVVAQAGRGLAAAHGRGLVHRDFKPDNILVDVEGRARVADFGLANTYGGRDAASSGSPAYMAPEIVNGEPPDARSDLYAFAVTLFEALHGAHPFAGTTVEAVWSEMALGRIRAGSGRVPRWFERHVRRGLAVERTKRWPDVKTFVDAIERGARRARRAVIAAGVACAIAAVIVAWSATRPAADSCERGQALVDTVWNAAARRAIGTGFTAAASDRAAPALAAASQLVDQWAGAWRLARRGACATPIERRAARIDCLDRQLDELRAQITLWSHPDATVVQRAAQAAGQLPAPAACTAATEMPPAAQPVMQQISKAKVLWRSGRMTEAKVAITQALHDAEQVGHHGVLAQALLSASIVEQDSELAAADGRAHADRAANEASKAGDDGLLYLALVNQARTRAVEGRPRDALGLCDAAEALAARGLPEPEKVVQMRGSVLADIGRTPEAIAVLERAIKLVEPRAQRGEVYARLQLASIRVDLSAALVKNHEMERALDQLTQARSAAEAILGPRHPTVAQIIDNTASVKSYLHQHDEAQRDFALARSLYVEAYGESHPDVAEVDVSLANVAARRGEPDQALRLLESARTTLARTKPRDDEAFAHIEYRIGQIELDRERDAAALAHFERAAEILRVRHRAGDDLARMYTAIADCQFNLGHLAEASSASEQALATLDEVHAPDGARLTPWTMLAFIADARHDRRRAIDFARKVVAATSDADVGHAAYLRKMMVDKLAAWKP